MQKIALSIVLYLLWFHFSNADDSWTYDLKGAGTGSCGTWTQDRLEGGDSALASIDENWVLGFIVGQEYMFARNANKSFTITTDSNGIFSWIDNYCQQNPIRDIDDAAEAFVTQSGTVMPKD